MARGFFILPLRPLWKITQRKTSNLSIYYGKSYPRGGCFYSSLNYGLLNLHFLFSCGGLRCWVFSAWFFQTDDSDFDSEIVTWHSLLGIALTRCVEVNFQAIKRQVKILQYRFRINCSIALVMHVETCNYDHISRHNQPLKVWLPRTSQTTALVDSY